MTEPNQNNSDSVDARIARLDIGLFSRIVSQTTDADKRSLLMVQAFTRTREGGYVYLEIGSHLGGSIQPHLLDPRCTRIYSIDKRPAAQPDERGQIFAYPENSTNRMLDLLRAIDDDGIRKIECLDGETRNLSPGSIRLQPNLCFVDGEHTPAAVVTDFDFCLKVCAREATIVFHDAQTVFRGLRSIVARLKKSGRTFSAHALLDQIYAICLDGASIRADWPGYSKMTRRDDLWSPRNDLRLLKWRAAALRGRIFRAGAENSR